MLGALGTRKFTGIGLPILRLQVLGLAALGLTALGALQAASAQTTDASTNVTCEAGQSLWIYELGTRGNAAAPDTAATVSSEPSLDIWTRSGDSMTTGRISGFPADIIGGRLYERFTPKPGTPSIQIGDFAVEWPSGDMAGGAKTGSVTPIAAPDAIGNVSDIDISSVYAGSGSGNLLDFLQSEARESGLTYFISSGAQFEYLRLALCSDVPPAPAPAPDTDSDDDPITIETVPTPRLKPDVETTGGGAEIVTSDSSQILSEDTSEGGDTPPQDDDNVKGSQGEGLDISLGGQPKDKTIVNDTGVSAWTIAALMALASLAIFGIGYGLKTGRLWGKRAASLKPNQQQSPIITLNANPAPPNVTQIAAAARAALIASQTVKLFRATPSGVSAPKGSVKGIHSEKPKREKSDIISSGLETGILFPRSPMHAMGPATASAPAAAPPPLVQAGQLSPANLQTLTGPYEVLRPAYAATGRLGPAQEGAPTSSDFALGTGFLITPRHVMTNRHVHRMWGHYLTGEGCDGIEFLAELDNEQSDYHPFDGNPPQLWDGLDIAVYTLAQPVTHRAPLELVAVETEALDGRDIVVFGYPDTLDPENKRFAHLVEDGAIFAVKRASQGQVFRHSSDDDVPYGVTTYLALDKRTKIDMPAICHNASTMTGNSGSPVLDVKTGALLGVHFAGKSGFAGAEDTNLAMAIAQIKQQEERYNLSALT